MEGLLSTIYDVFLDQIVDGQIYTKGTGERDPAREHWTRLHELNLAQNALLVFDRGYYSKELYEDLVSDGCHVLMRLNKGNHLTRLGSDDFFMDCCFSRWQTGPLPSCKSTTARTIKRGSRISGH